MAENVQYSRQTTGGIAVGDKGKSGNPYEAYFGAPNGEIKTGAYDRLASVSDTLPDAYAGQSLFLRDTIEGFIREANEFYTTVMLPWAYTDQQRIKWTVWRFNKTLAGYVPHEGVSRMITHSRAEFEREITRRGLAFMIEHGFWKTPAGQENYARNVMGIKQCIQETVNYDVMNETLRCKRYQRKWREDHDGTTREKLDEMLAREVALYGTVQKNVNGFEILLIEYRQIAQRMGVRPNMIVVPPSFRIYYSKVPRERTQYWLFGPDGTLRLKQGPEGVNLGTEYLFETRLLDIYDRDERGIDMLRRERTVGEHYFVQDPYRDRSHARFEASHLDTYVYREPADDFRRITFGEAFKHVNRFSPEDGMPSVHHERLRDMDPFEVPGDTEFGTTPMDTGSTSRAGSAPANVDSIMRKHQASYYDDQPVYGRQTYEAQTFDKNRDVFLYVDDDGNYQVVQRLGQMEIQYFTHADVEQHALTCARSQGLDAEEDAYNRLMSFVRSIEQQPYHAHYTKALIEANLTAMLDVNGNVRTDVSTQPDLLETYGVPPIFEFAHNEYGGLDLPAYDRNTMKNLRTPPFTSAWPMMQTLAEQGAQMGWPERTVRRAEDAVKFTQKFGRHMAQVYHTSALVAARFRSPWFQDADFLTTLWENVVTVPRPAVFLNIVPTAGATPGAGPADLPRADAGPSRAPRADAGPAATTSQQALARAVPSLRQMLERVAGHEDEAIQREWNTIFNVVPADAEAAAADFDRDAYVSDLTHVLMAAARYKPDPKTTAKKQCVKARCNVRQTVRAFAGEYAVGTETLPGYGNVIRAVNGMKGLIPGVKDAAKRKRATRALDKILQNERFWNPRDEEADPQALPPQNVEEWRILTQRGEGLQDLMERKQEMLDLARELDRAAPNVRARQTVTGAFDADDLVGIQNATVPPNAEELRDQFLASAGAYLAAVDAIDQRLAEDIQETFMPAVDTEQPTIQDTRAAYTNGVWVRAPLSATPGLVNSLKNQEFPLAVPSDPNNAHLTPILRDEASLRHHASHPMYRAKVTSSMSGQGRGFEHTSWCRSMLRPDFEGSTKIRSSSSSSRRRVGVRRDPMRESPNDLVGALLGRRGSHGTRQPLVGMHTTEERDREEWDAPHHHGQREGEPRVMRMVRSETHRQVNSGNFLARYEAANAYTSPIHRMIAHVYLASRNTERQWLTFLNKDCLPPGRITLWRLWITHKMYTMIFMLGGYMTGATFYGGSNAELGDDVVSQFHYANFTFYSKAIVTTPDNVFLAEDVFFAGYVRGNDVKFLRDASDIDFMHGNHNGDIIATLGPYRQGIGSPDEPNPMDFTGVHHYPGYDGSQDPDAPHWVGAPYYEIIFGLDEMAKRRNQITTGFHGRASRANTTSFWGHQISYSPTQRGFSDHHIGTGHLGGKNTVGPGAAAVRNGQPAPFPEQNLLEMNK